MKEWSLISCQVFSNLIRHYRRRLLYYFGKWRFHFTRLVVNWNEMINCTYFFLNIQHFCTQLYICELCFVFVNRILWIYIFILCTWISFCNFFFVCMWIGFHACELGYVCIMSFVWIIIDTNLTPYKKSCSLNINKYYFDSSCYYSQWEIKFKEYKFKKNC